VGIFDVGGNMRSLIALPSGGEWQETTEQDKYKNRATTATE
jgi:hypothetical protein